MQETEAEYGRRNVSAFNACEWMAMRLVTFNRVSSPAQAHTISLGFSERANSDER
jgi:hypothetical protein